MGVIIFGVFLKEHAIVVGSIVSPGEGIGPSRELFSVLDVSLSADHRDIEFAVVGSDSPENEFLVAVRVVFICVCKLGEVVIPRLG